MQYIFLVDRLTRSISSSSARLHGDWLEAVARVSDGAAHRGWQRRAVGGVEEVGYPAVSAGSSLQPRSGDRG
jgi:hypothetical protein